MNKLASSLMACAVVGVPVAVLASQGIYGWSVFVAAPFAAGALAVLFERPCASSAAAGTGLLTALVGCCGFLALGLEGMICILMALPLAAAGTFIGAMLMFALIGERQRGPVALLLLLLPPGAGTIETRAGLIPPLYEVRTAIEVAAPPEAVWKHVIAFPDLAPPTEWYFRTGIAYPLRARIEGHGPGAIRRCEFTTGPFVEPIEVWDENRLLRFRVTENPRPMAEWSPYGPLDAKHLDGYLVSERGQFLLTPLPGGRTRLEGTTWYRHHLWPAHYWRWWSDAILHRIHKRVLLHVARLAETGAPLKPLPAPCRTRCSAASAASSPLRPR